MDAHGNTLANAPLLNIATQKVEHQGRCERDSDDRENDAKDGRGTVLRTEQEF